MYYDPKVHALWFAVHLFTDGSHNFSLPEVTEHLFHSLKKELDETLLHVNCDVLFQIDFGKST